MEKELELYLDKYLNNNSFFSFVGSCTEARQSFKMSKRVEQESCLDEACIDDYIDNNKNDDKFQMLLFKYIDRLDKKDSEIYNKANIDRRLFSKIRSNKDYHPSKNTVISLGLALNLNEDEIVSLLNSASYSLPFNNKFDLIIRFCFINKIYDINEVNNLLFNHNCNTLEKV